MGRIDQRSHPPPLTLHCFIPSDRSSLRSAVCQITIISQRGHCWGYSPSEAIIYTCNWFNLAPTLVYLNMCLIILQSLWISAFNERYWPNPLWERNTMIYLGRYHLPSHTPPPPHPPHTHTHTPSTQLHKVYIGECQLEISRIFLPIHFHSPPYWRGMFQKLLT